jgi:hypothetical protein
MRASRSCPQTDWSSDFGNCALELLNNARSQLLPPLEAVIESFDETADTAALAFFTLILTNLHGLQDDGDLMGLFFELSTTAFQGFVFSPAQAQLVDSLLAAAENIAFTLSAPGDNPH